MFCDDFVWGVASSAYQVEGKEEGEGKQYEKDKGFDYQLCGFIHNFKVLMR